MKNLSRNEKILIGILIFLLVFYVYYTYLLTPVLNKTSAAAKQLEAGKDELQRVKIVELSNKKQNDQLTQMKNKFIEASKALPQSERNPEIYYEVKKIADDNKTLMEDISLGKGVEYKYKPNSKSTDNKPAGNNSEYKLMVVPVVVNLSGAYDSIMNFLKSIEQDKRIAEVTSLNLNSTSADTLHANISINYYYISTDNNPELKYDFNKGTYGKDNLFN